MRVNTTFKNSSRGTCKFTYLVFVRVLSESYLPTPSAPIITCLYSAVSLTLVREKCFIIIIMYLFIRPSISMYLISMYLSVYPSVYVATYLSIYDLSICLVIYIIYLSAYLSAYLFLSACLPLFAVYLSAYMSVCQFDYYLSL